MTQHTPGPWKVAEAPADDYEGGGLRIFSLSDAEIAPAQAYGDTPEQEAANARLIAAAPDLLEALNGLLDNAPTPNDTKRDYRYILYREAAKTAITKAIGE